MREVILSTENLAVGYGNRTVVEGIDLSAVRGEILCLIGPNGAGKSTILKTLIRQLRPLSGAIRLKGKDLAGIPEKELARSCAAVLTGSPAPELMRCGELVALGRYPYTGRLGILTESDRRIVRESMEMTETAELKDLDFSRISDGQRQRVLLARAICQEPELLIMDEPTSFLDIRHKLEFMHLLRNLISQKQISVVLSLHELDLAQKFADRILCIRDGKTDRTGPPEEIFQGEYIQELFRLTHGSYVSLTGTAEAGRTEDRPRIFVIGGGGSGIPVYRMLTRNGIPFAAGVLAENDLDLPTARALAAEVITVPPNEPVSPESIEEAMTVLRGCEAVLCPQRSFGSVNRRNEELLRYAQEHGLLRDGTGNPE